MTASEPKWLSSEAIHLLHDQQLERFGGRPGVLDDNVVESAVARPRNLFHYGGEEMDIASFAAAYLCGFAQKQGFADGNKRVGVAAMLVFLAINGRLLHVPSPELYRVTMGVANGEIAEAEVAEWIRQSLRK